MVLSKTIKLKNGMEMPILGLGTWQADNEGECEEATKTAIDIGYRHFDCAALYGNEAEIGRALRAKIADGSVKRKDLFITTKLWNDCHDPQMVVNACKKSLAKFGLEYLDLYLIHWPCGYEHKEGEIFPEKFTTSKYTFVDIWREMEKCVKMGLTRSIGISNFNHKQIDTLLNSGITISPVVNQIEVHPNLQQKKLIKFCKDRGIEIVAYSPFGSPTRPWQKPGDPVVRLDDPTLIAIGQKYKKTPSQVILRYLVELGTCPIPKSTNKDRLSLNIDIFDFELSEEDHEFLEKFECNGRICAAIELKSHPEYPFNIEY